MVYLDLGLSLQLEIMNKTSKRMKNKKLNYIPQIKFAGYTECFKNVYRHD